MPSPLYCGTTYIDGKHIILQSADAILCECNGAVFYVPSCSFGKLEDSPQGVNLQLQQAKISGLLNVGREVFIFYHHGRSRRIVVPEGMYTKERLVEVINTLCQDFIQLEFFQDVDTFKLRLEKQIDAAEGELQMSISQTLWQKLGFTLDQPTTEKRITITLEEPRRAMSAPNLEAALNEIFVHIEIDKNNRPCDVRPTELDHRSIIGRLSVGANCLRNATANQCLTFTPASIFHKSAPAGIPDVPYKISLTDSFGELIPLHPQFGSIEIVMRFVE